MISSTTACCVNVIVVECVTSVCLDIMMNYTSTSCDNSCDKRNISV